MQAQTTLHLLLTPLEQYGTSLWLVWRAVSGATLATQGDGHQARCRASPRACGQNAAALPEGVSPCPCGRRQPSARRRREVAQRPEELRGRRGCRLPRVLGSCGGLQLQVSPVWEPRCAGRPDLVPEKGQEGQPFLEEGLHAWFCRGGGGAVAGALGPRRGDTGGAVGRRALGRGWGQTLQRLRQLPCGAQSSAGWPSSAGHTTAVPLDL